MSEPKYLRKRGDIYFWTGPFETKDAPKKAGFRWHNPFNCRSEGSTGRCRACKAKLTKVWWTGFVDQAAKLVEYADDNARVDLDAHNESVRKSRASTTELEFPSPEGLEFLPYQKAGIEYMMDRPGTLLADEMGLGKSVESLGVINTDTSVKTVLVFCPASLRINWLREAQRWLTRPFNFFLVEKTTDIPGPEHNFVIVSYTCAAGRGSKKLQEALMGRSWDVLICDEVHLLKNKSTARAKLVLGYYSKAKKAKIPGISARVGRKMYLSGTPMPNKPIEMQGILGDLAPQTFGYVISFGRRYCDGYQSRWGWNFEGASNLDELQEKARGTCMIRRLKADVLKELPPKRRQVICLPTNGASSVLRMEEQTYSEYEDRLTGLQAQADLASTSGNEEAYKAAMKALSHLYMVAFNEMSRIRRDVALAKLPAVIEHLERALDTEKKVVVFGHHREVVHRISEHFGDEAVHITGTTTPKKRQEAVDRFQEDCSVRVFVGNMKAAGVGYTLTAASLVVFAELDWVPSVITQAEDRLHRLGQLHHVLVQHLVYDGSIDSRIAHAIVVKQEVADKALDDPSHLDFECPALPVVKAPPKPKKFPEVSQRERLAAREILGALSDHDKLGGLGAALFKKMDGLLPDDREVWMIKRIAKPHVELLPMEELRVLELD